MHKSPIFCKHLGEIIVGSLTSDLFWRVSWTRTPRLVTFGERHIKHNGEKFQITNYCIPNHILHPDKKSTTLLGYQCYFRSSSTPFHIFYI